MPGSPTSRSTRSYRPLSAWASASRPSPTAVVSNPADRRPLATKLEIRCSSSAIRMAVMPTSRSAERSRSRGRANPIRLPLADDATTMRPPCARTIDCTMESPSPEPAAPLVSARPNRSRMRSSAPAGMPGPPSRTQNSTSPGRSVEPMKMGVPDGEYFAALSASCSQACTIFCRSTDTRASAVPPPRQSWPGIPCALARTSAVSSADRMPSRRITSMRLSARTPISSISPDIRSSSSMAIARVAWVSDGSDGSSSSRWPRTIVIGVLSSCCTSSSSRRWLVRAESSRSSMSFTVTGQLRDVVAPDHRDAGRALRRRDLLRREPQPADRREQPADRREARRAR